MISYEQILNEIERQIERARQTQNIATIRESFAAIRSLSDLVLDSHKEERLFPRKANYANMQKSQPLQNDESKRLEEEDGANGHSIFDF